MEMKKKVVAAVAAAVSLYLQAEQQVAAPLVEEQVREPAPPTPTYSPWVMAGRMATMELRRSWQMRLVH
jgi:hypothetical protein